MYNTCHSCSLAAPSANLQLATGTSPPTPTITALIAVACH